MELLRAAAFVIVGLMAGVLSGSMGIGGAVLATPMIRLLGVGPYLAVGSTVLAILPSAVTGAFTYMRAGLVDVRAAAWVGGVGTISAYAGARATRLVDGHLLMLATAVLLLVMALRLAVSGSKISSEPGRSGVPAYGLLGVVAGLLSGLLGVGGGSVLVPALVGLFGFPIKRALGTSLAIIAVTASASLIGQIQVGNVHWQVSLLLAVGVVPGARIGALMAISAGDKVLRQIAAVVLGAIALVYAFSELAALLLS